LPAPDPAVVIEHLDALDRGRHRPRVGEPELVDDVPATIGALHRPGVVAYETGQHRREGVRDGK
jgi:hypothetical protein